MPRRQTSAAPESRVERLSRRPADGSHHDIGGQAAIRPAQPVAHPRPEARASMLLTSRVDVGDRGIVVDRFGVHRSDDREIIHNGRQVRKQFGIDPGSALSATFEFEPGRDTQKLLLAARHGRQSLPFSDTVGERLAVDLPQPGLVVEEVDVARAAGHEEIDDPLRPRREVRQRGQPGNLGKRRGEAVLFKQAGECSGSQQGLRGVEEPAAGKRETFNVQR